ncbi:MAG: flagella basal body P-ring formation protein FlgA, partial [Microvirgula sp.]
NPAFNVSAQGVAMTAGSEGQSVGVRMPNGRILRGTARADGSVAIRY